MNGVGRPTTASFDSAADTNPTGADRKAGQDVYFKYYDGLAPDLRPADNPQNLLSQFIAATIDPQDLYGTTALGWRYRDPSGLVLGQKVEPGTDKVTVRGKAVPMEVAAMPFVPNRYYRG